MSSNSEGSDNPGSSRHDVISVTDQSATDRRRRLKAREKSIGKGQRVVSPRLEGSGPRTDEGGYRGHTRDKSRGHMRGNDHWKSVERDIRAAMSFANERAQMQKVLENHDEYSGSDPDD